MFTQFFGSYLLNKKIVSPANLRVALEKKDTTRVKLGVLCHQRRLYDGKAG